MPLNFMQITFYSYTQPLVQYISGAANLEPLFVRLLVHQCEQGSITAPQLTFIVEGATRADATFSTP
jgi:hypothetical protein